MSVNRGKMPNTDAVIDAMPGRAVPNVVNILSGVGILWMLIGLGYGFGVAGAAWTWGAFIVALVFSLAIAQGGVMFGVMLSLTHGRWGIPVKRIAESFGFYLPIGYVLLLILLVAGQGLYPWNSGQWLLPPEATPPGWLAPHSPAAVNAKEVYLNWPFWAARQAGGLGVMVVLSMFYLRASLRPDMVKAAARLKETNPSWQPPALWGYMMGGAGELQAEVDDGETKRDLFGALLAICYPFVFSFMTFDLIMSLAPWWFANMFGTWFMVSSFWIALCFLGVVMMTSKEWLGIEGFVKNNISHDLGKLVLALSMFWAYTTYAQILPIWYANMPEETDFLLIRMFLPQWSWMARTVAVLCFITPFTTLLSRGIKKMRWPFVTLLLLILVGLFLERTLQVMPSVWFEDYFPWDAFLLTSCGLTAGFVGILLAVSYRVMAIVPPMPISDPHLAPHPWDEHVHSLDHAHH